MSSIAGPSVLPKSDLSAPVDALELEWVHGYRAQDARQNLFYTAAGAIVYPAAALVKRWKLFRRDRAFAATTAALSPKREPYIAPFALGRWCGSTRRRGSKSS